MAIARTANDTSKPITAIRDKGITWTADRKYKSIGWRRAVMDIFNIRLVAKVAC